VLILGETGTGKELAARAVHAWRYGGSEKFVAVNCAALTASLLESELFGHARGSFTGADRERVGLFEQAGDGSLFLDEISEMAPDLQAKLLRVLQERTFRKVGGTCDIACNATIIASSNRNLLEEVNKGRFRGDLYYRLAVFPVTMAPLRDPRRRQDIPLLAQYFVEHLQVRKEQTGSIGAAAAAKLMTHDWPGNVRELRNVIERALIVERSAEITPRSLMFDSPGPAGPGGGPSGFGGPPEANGSPVRLPGSGRSPSSAAAVVDFPVVSPPAGSSGGGVGGIGVDWPVEDGVLPDVLPGVATGAPLPMTTDAQTPRRPGTETDVGVCTLSDDNDMYAVGDVLPVSATAGTAVSGGGSSFSSGDFSLEAAEREFIRRALKETGWQRTRAADLLGITRATLHAKIKRYNIRPDDAPLAMA